MIDKTRISVFIEAGSLFQLADEIEAQRSFNRDGNDTVDACNAVFTDIATAIRSFANAEIARAA